MTRGGGIPRCYMMHTRAERQMLLSGNPHAACPEESCL